MQTSQGEWGRSGYSPRSLQQARVTSPMDERIDVVLDLLAELFTVTGFSHIKPHFSSSRATLWSVDDPHRFRIHGIEEISNPGLCLANSRRDYPVDSDMPKDAVPRILRCFRDPRFMDQTIGLRSAMLNIFNRLIGLTFSCGGSHYMPWEEFLDKVLGFGSGHPAKPACV